MQIDPTSFATHRLDKDATMASKDASSFATLTPVYVKCAQYAWIPAALVDLAPGSKTASVILPKFRDEQEMLEVNLEEMDTLQKGWKTQPKLTQVNLTEYENGILPLQNVEANNKGQLADWGDMVGLPYLHEAAILYNLKKRHVQSKPYTRTGDIMIAVNPYQWLEGLYSEESRHQYARELIWTVSERDARLDLDPHIYEVAALSYKGMAVDGMDQSILVSGESGAGKTETVKLCMNFIASLHTTASTLRSNSRDAECKDEEASKTNVIVQRILDSSPVLEAFGNAKTRRNDNSSRFGKYTQLQLDRLAVLPTPSAHLAGSTCEVYLLEKNRVVSHDDEERTFHVLYQILAAPEEIKKQIWSGLAGTNNESFAYVGPTSCKSIEGKTDAERFDLVAKALELLGVKGETWLQLMRAICMVLQLGNIGFQADPSNEDASQIDTQEDFEALAELMGISQQNLTDAFTERTFLARGEVMTVLLKADQAKDSCHALAKEIYGQTFLWLVRAINEATSADNNFKRVDGTIPKLNSYGIIGLLDIFGFESFATNRFEQLCINFANEKLQQKFTEDIFRSVQKEYEEEGLSLADIAYDDNADILKLIEGRSGLIDLLNEECMLPKSNPENFVRKLGEQHKGSSHMKVDRIDKLTFGINHYAGTVEYYADNFVDLNRDTLPSDLKKCAALSTNAIVAQQFRDQVNGDRASAANGDAAGTVVTKTARSGMSNETLSARYRDQLSHLMSDLRKTQSRYIRCIKPNTVKKPRILEHQTTVEQLRYAGVISGITISRSAFPNRLPNTTVMARYKTMWDKKKFPSEARINSSDDEKRREDCIAMLTGLLSHMVTTDKNGNMVKAFVAGKTKTYFRGGALEYLQSRRLNVVEALVATIQTAARAWIIRNRYKERRELARMHRLQMKAFNEEIASLKAQLAEDRIEEVSAFEEKAARFHRETKDYRRKIEIIQKSEEMRIQQEYATLKKALDEKQAEEDRIRKLNQHLEVAFKKLEKEAESLRASNKKLEEDGKAKTEQNTAAKSGAKNYNKMRSDLARLERENKDLERDLKKQKFQQLEMEKKLFDTRTRLNKVFNFILSTCQNEALVDEIVAFGNQVIENANVVKEKVANNTTLCSR